MNKLVKYGKEVNVGDKVVVYKYEGERFKSPEIYTVTRSRVGSRIHGADPVWAHNDEGHELQFLTSISSSGDVWRPLVRKGDKLHVFKYEEEELEEPKIVTVDEDETEESALVFIKEHVLPDAISNVLDVRDADMDEWYFYSEEAEDYPVEWYEDPIKEERTSWVANEGGEDVSVAIDIAGNISDSYNDCESSDVVYYTPSDDDDEEEYTPMSYAEYNAAHGGGKTLKDYTGVDITRDTLAFESAVEKTLKGITSESLAFEESVKDNVNHPDHYTHGDIETIEMIKEITKGYDDGFVAYCVGNSVKYESRAPFKHDNPKEDIDKAIKYLSFASDYLAEVDE